MEYLLTFLDGIASFISPCILPMLPIYISYFMGEEDKSTKKALKNSLGFVTGFTLVFILLAVIASLLGNTLTKNMHWIKIVLGIIIILIGLNYMDIIKLKFKHKTKQVKADTKNLNFVKAMILGALLSITWTGCTGAFLSSALLLIAKEGHMIKGIILMTIYSLGLGVPFIVSVFLIEKFKKVFDFIKQNYNVVRKISGLILIVMGIYTMFF